MNRTSKRFPLQELCADREKKLQLALDEAVALDKSMRDTAEWLAAAEQRLAAAVSLPSHLQLIQKPRRNRHLGTGEPTNGCTREAGGREREMGG